MDTALVMPSLQVLGLTCQIFDTVTGTREIRGGQDAVQWCRALERGGILFFPKSPIVHPSADIEFLLTQKQLESPRHKNIAYRPLEDRLTGVSRKSDVDTQRLHAILKQHAQQSGRFLDAFLTPYKGWQWDYTTFRPMEEYGRKLRLRARNDLIHIDSFPTRPTFGGRILRFFTNIHPYRDRVWQTSETFENIVPRYRYTIPRPSSWEFCAKQASDSSPWRWMQKMLGFRQSERSPYDHWMMRLHNRLKQDAHFQTICPKAQWHFPPGSAWMVLTDMVSHSVLSGQYALEQTVIIPLESMMLPEKAPVNLLKTGRASARYF